MIYIILIGILIYNLLYFCNFFGTYGVSGSIQVPINHFLLYYKSLFCNNNSQIELLKYDKDYTTIYGYCCRQLFHIFINNLKNRKSNLKIGVTPIHHTSFRNILENNFEKENIHIFDIDENYNKIIIKNKDKYIKYDLIVVTHLWGKYLDISEIKKLDYDLIVEDVVLGGEFKNEFKTESDVLFHSCGMDKRPSSIFGGYVKVKNDKKTIINNFKSSLEKLEYPTKYEIIKKLNDVMILNLVYNNRFIQNLVKLYIYFSKFKLNEFIAYVRKKKPGFEHNNYMKKPNKLMINICKTIHRSENETEKLFISKHKLFLEQFTEEQIAKYFPWHKNNLYSCLPYTPIYIENHKKFIDFFNKRNICVINNPTYKTFKHVDNKINILMKNIFYMPSLHKLSYDNIIVITNLIKQFII
jgi:hypothetical protein